MPTLGPLLDKTIGAQSATLLYTPYTQISAEHQATVLQKHCIKTELLALPDPYHLQPLIDSLTPLAEQHPNGACINITGGSKLMSIAAWQVFNQPQHHLYYVHLHNDSIVCLNHNKPDHAISDTIKLPDYFAAHGYQVTGNSATPAHPVLMQLARTLAQGTYQNEHVAIINAGIEESKTGGNHLTIPYSNSKKMLAFVQLLCDANIATVKHNHLHLDDSSVWRFLNGEWLEQVTLDAILTLAKHHQKFQDIAIGLKVSNPKQSFSGFNGMKQALSNELDVVILHDNTLYLIECKGGKKFPNEADNYTTKLDSLRDTLGGIKGKGLIISQYALTQGSEKRAAEYRIKTLSGSQAIKQLEQHLAEWLGC
ncbi:MAG: DUF1887 family protein [Proteobacteria bacterium]|nr:DUF1887 family protein [Pseudomonadota bacterium]